MQAIAKPTSKDKGSSPERSPRHSAKSSSSAQKRSLSQGKKEEELAQKEKHDSGSSSQPEPSDESPPPTPVKDGAKAAEPKKKPPLPPSSPTDTFRRLQSPGVNAAAKVPPQTYSSGDSKEAKKNKKTGDESMRIRDFPRSQQKAVILDKLQQCSVLYDFNVRGSKTDKESKRQALMQLVDYINNLKTAMDEETIKELICMIKINLLRGLKVQERNMLDFLMEGEDGETYADPAWFHLEYVYALFARVLSTSRSIMDFKVVQSALGSSFVHTLFEYFDSDDSRERETLKSVVLQMYNKLSKLKDVITYSLRAELTKAVYESDVHKGVKELLELASELTRGFSAGVLDIKVPKDFLTRILIPLHKLFTLHDFHTSLMSCIKKYVDLDARLTYVIITKLLKVWPVGLASKQVLYLDEIEEMLKVTPQIQFRRMQDALVRRIAVCIESPHYQVAERALLLWHTEGFVKLINQNARTLLPHLIGPLSKAHWFHAVNQRLPNVIQLLKETNQAVYQQSLVASEQEAERKSQLEATRAEKWAALQLLFDNSPRVKKQEAGAARRNDASTGKAKNGSKKSLNTTDGATSGNQLSGSPSDCEEFWGETILPGRASSKTKKGRKNGIKVSTRMSNLQLGNGIYGVAVRWNDSFIQRKAQCDLQAIIVDGKGEVIDAVHLGRTSVCEAAVRQLKHTADAPFLGPTDYHSIVWVTLPRLPVEVELLVILLAVDRKAPLDADVALVHVLQAERDNHIARFSVDMADSNIGVLVTIQRASSPSTTASPRSEFADKADAASVGEKIISDWSMARVEGDVRQGRHFMDIWEPVLGDLIRAALPKVPRTQRVTLPLKTGASVDLPDVSVARWLYVGVAWDLMPPYQVGGFRLDVSAVLLDKDGQQVDSILPASRPSLDDDASQDDTMQFTSSGPLGEGVVIDWDKVSPEVAQVFILGHVSPESSGASVVQNITATIVDPAGTVLVRHNLDNAGAVARTGIIVARIVRDAPSLRFQALGAPCSGRTSSESSKDIDAIFHKSMEDMLPASTFRSAPGSQGFTRFRMSL